MSQAFRVVFEDRSIIVVEKAAMVLSVPTPRGERNTMVQLVERYLERRGARRPLTVVHRLDRETSGLLVLAKDRASGDKLEQQFRAHSPERVYRAIVAGSLTRDQGTFDSFLATSKSLTRFSTGDRDQGERAITHFEVDERVRGATLISARLETGRRNQIRAHFAEAGHPVLGDRRYRPEQARHAAWPYPRLALHAASLAFSHPVTSEPLRFESPLPREFVAFLRAAGSAHRA